MRAGECQRLRGRKRCVIHVAGLEAHVGAVLAIKNMRKALRVLDAEKHESGEALRVGPDRGNVHALVGERRAHEASHMLVADARQHCDLEAEARESDRNVAGRTAEILGEMLCVLEPRTAFEAVEIHRGAAEADEIDRARHFGFAGAFVPASGRCGGSQIFAPGFIVHACSSVNSGTS
jgi:hypothetical protein